MRSKRRLRWAVLPVGIAAAVTLAGCTPQELHGFLPGFVEDGTPATDRTDMIAGLWVNSWIVLLAVGVITWGLLVWAMIVYRRRRGQSGLPVQLRYNMPIEIFYTVVPLILVLGFFAFTARDQAAIEAPTASPDVKIDVYAKRWAWDFNYIDQQNEDESVYYQGIQAQELGDGTIDESQLPELYLPVGKTVQIDLKSRDVAHSFWIIDFLYKKDMYIGKDNYWSFTPTRVGEYDGKCAELCGQYHSMMLFKVKVVEQAEYDAYLDGLRDAGQTGDINEAYNRLQNLPGTGASESEGEH